MGARPVCLVQRPDRDGATIAVAAVVAMLAAPLLVHGPTPERRERPRAVSAERRLVEGAVQRGSHAMSEHTDPSPYGPRHPLALFFF